MQIIFGDHTLRIHSAKRGAPRLAKPYDPSRPDGDVLDLAQDPRRAALDSRLLAGSSWQSELCYNATECNAAEEALVRFEEPQDAVGCSYDLCWVVIRGQREFDDSAGGWIEAADAHARGFGEPDVAVRAGDDAFGIAALPCLLKACCQLWWIGSLSVAPEA